MKRYITKLLSVLLAVVLIVGLLPATALAAEEYNVWVGGVQVTDSNRNDVLGDGTVAFTPAAGSEQAKLKLYGANITGTSLPKYPDDNYGIYSEIDLTLELNGASTVTGTDAENSSCGILFNRSHLTVTGNGVLNVTAGAGTYSCALNTNSMIIRSGTIRATAGKSSDESEGIYSNYFVMVGGALVATGGEAPRSWGVGGSPTIKGGTVIAIGETRAFWLEPDLSDYADPAVKVHTQPSDIDAKAWNGTDLLGADGSSFKFVRIEPVGYDVWVGGMRVTEANKANVLGNGTVVFTPGTLSNPAKLTLNNAKITGTELPEYPNEAVAIFTMIELTLELVGSNKIIGTDASKSSFGIVSDGKKLTITGGGTLDVSAGDSAYSCAIRARSLTIQSGAIRATAGKSSDESEGIYSNVFTMEGGTLIAAGGEAPKSWGVGGFAAINGGIVTAYADTRAFFAKPDLSDYADPAVEVTTKLSSYTTSWNGTDALGGEGSSWKYVRIDPAGYDTWVSGVRVAHSNRNDVLADGGSVKYTPATESEDAKLTLNNANITGALRPGETDSTVCIYSEEDLTLELHGSSTVTGTDAVYNHGIIINGRLTVTGEGTLDVSAGDGWNSEGIAAVYMIMRSGTIRATAGKGQSGSEAVGFREFTMEGGTLIAEAGESPCSWGLDGKATIKGGTLIATGQSSAFYRYEPDLSGAVDPDVLVNTEPTETGAKAWNGTDALGDEGSFKYVRIESTGYDVWVGGVRVADDNKADVLGDGGSVKYDSDSNTLTLNNANITGALLPYSSTSTAGIYAMKDLTLELVGSSSITGTDASDGSAGILLDNYCLTVTGSGTLDVTAGSAEISSGIFSTYKLIMRSGTVRATAGKALNYSEAVFSNDFTMEGGTLIAEAGESPRSRGICGDATIKGGTVIATGQTRAFDEEPDLSGYADPAVTVNTESSETGAKAWNGTDALGGSGSSYKYVSVAPAMLKNPFIDVAEGAYYYDAVLWAVNATPQVTSGTSYNTFSPNATCTRAQVVTFLWRAKGCPEPEMDAASSLFTDVPEGSYYYKAVLWAVENKITNGTSTTTFSPNMGCTRGQVVTFLHRFAGAPAPSGGANPFTDVAEGTYYYDAVLWAVEKGITKGTSATTFSPNATCTRGQIVTFLYRAMK